MTNASSKRKLSISFLISIPESQEYLPLPKRQKHTQYPIFTANDGYEYSTSDKISTPTLPFRKTPHKRPRIFRRRANIRFPRPRRFWSPTYRVGAYNHMTSYEMYLHKMNWRTPKWLRDERWKPKELQWDYVARTPTEIKYVFMSAVEGRMWRRQENAKLRKQILEWRNPEQVLETPSEEPVVVVKEEPIKKSPSPKRSWTCKMQ